MRRTLRPLVDPRRAPALHADLLARARAYVPQWRPRPKEPGDALARIAARYLEIILERLNQAPDKNRLAFFDLLGMRLLPAQPARAPLVVQLSTGSATAQLKAGSQVAAAPPAGASSQIVFETESSVGLSAAKLVELVSLWPGRDQFIDHGPDVLAGNPIHPWRLSDLEDCAHVLYIAHGELLALSGDAALAVEIELAQAGSDALAILWEYWDGEAWRSFAFGAEGCSEPDAPETDTTRGLTASGKVLLQADCIETARTSINGIESYWVRGRLDETLVDSKQILPSISEIRLGPVVER